MLFERILHYLKTHGTTSLLDMSHALNISQNTLRQILSLLEQRHFIRRLPQGTICPGGCCRCAPESIELYEWIAHAESHQDARLPSEGCCFP